MARLLKAEPWKIKRSKNTADNNRPVVSSKNKTGGGDNPSRTSLNRNKSGDHKVPDHLKGDRLDRSGGPGIGEQVPDLAGHPARNGRNPSGSKDPKIVRGKPNNSLKRSKMK